MYIGGGGDVINWDGLASCLDGFEKRNDFVAGYNLQDYHRFVWHHRA